MVNDYGLTDGTVDRSLARQGRVTVAALICWWHVSDIGIQGVIILIAKTGWILKGP